MVSKVAVKIGMTCFSKHGGCGSNSNITHVHESVNRFSPSRLQATQP
jgi:hypothetical protein